MCFVTNLCLGSNLHTRAELNFFQVTSPSCRASLNQKESHRKCYGDPSIVPLVSCLEGQVTKIDCDKAGCCYDARHNECFRDIQGYTYQSGWYDGAKVPPKDDSNNEAKYTFKTFGMAKRHCDFSTHCTAVVDADGAFQLRFGGLGAKSSTKSGKTVRK